MNRTQLEHVLRAASQIAGEPDVLVISDRVALLDDVHPVATERVIGWLSKYPRT